MVWTFGNLNLHFYEPFFLSLLSCNPIDDDVVDDVCGMGGGPDDGAMMCVGCVVDVASVVGVGQVCEDCVHVCALI